MKLLKFEAEHCMQCKGLDMRMKGWATIPVIHVDADNDDERVNKFDIRNVPTLILTNDSEEEIYGRWGNVSNMAEIDARIKEVENGL